MSKTIRRWRVRAAFASFVVLATCFALPHFFLLELWGRLRGDDGLTRCRRASHGFFVFWCRVWLRLYRVIGGIRFRFSIRDGDPYMDRANAPFLAISNHHGAFDAALLCEIGAMTGRRDFRTVTMREAGEWPVIGNILRELRFAFVRRSRDQKDVDDLREFGAQVHRDTASAMIFPEGHIFEEPVPDSGFERVLPPKSKGIKAMLERMPEHPVLSVTINWHDHDISLAALMGAIPPGFDVTVSARVVHGVTPENVKEFLALEWKKKDAILSAPPRRS